MVDITKTQALLGALVGGLAGGLTGSGDTQGSQGYTGGIPSLTAERGLVPDAFGQTYTTPTGALAPRRPGSVGRRYFTDVNYTPVTDETGAPTIMGGAEIAAMNQAALNRQQELTQLGQDLIGLYGQNNAATDDTTGLYGQDNAATGDTTGTTGTTGTTLTTPDAFTTFITPFIGRTPTAEDAITLANSGYSVDQISSALGYTPDSLQTFLDYYTSGAGASIADTGGDDTVVGAGGDDTADTAAAEQIAFDTFINSLPAPENLTIYDVEPILNSGYSTVEIAAALGIPESVLGELVREWSGSELAVFPAADTTTTEDTAASLITGAGDEGANLTLTPNNTTEDTQDTAASLITGAGDEGGSLTLTPDNTTETAPDAVETLLNSTEQYLVANNGWIDNGDGTLTTPSGRIYNDGVFTNPTDTTPTETTTTGTTPTGTTTTETTTPTDLETFAQNFTFSGDEVTPEEAQTLIGSGFTVAQLADQFNVTEESLQNALNYYGGDQYTFDTFISPFRGRELGQQDAVALANSGYTPEQIASGLKVDINTLKDFLAFADTTTTGTTPTGTTTTETTTPTDLETFAQNFTFSGDTVTADEAQTLIGSGFTVAQLADQFNVTEESLQNALDYHTSGQYGLNTFVAALPDKLDVNAGKAILNSNYTAAQLAPLLNVTEADLADFLTKVQAEIENEETTELASGGYLNYAQGGDVQGDAIFYDENSNPALADREYGYLTTKYGMGPMDPASEEGRREIENMERERRRESTRTPIEYLVDMLTANKVEDELRLRNTSGDRRRFNQMNPGFLSQLEAMKEARERIIKEQDNRYAQGGIAQGQGYYLGGTTDGMADDVPATIDGREPARLSDGEFVIPADVVSHLGNGNSDAGAKNLYSMMERVRKDRTGNPEQGRQIDPNKYLA